MGLGFGFGLGLGLGSGVLARVVRALVALLVALGRGPGSRVPGSESGGFGQAARAQAVAWLLRGGEGSGPGGKHREAALSKQAGGGAQRGTLTVLADGPCWLP